MRKLIIAPHVDDEVIGCGGILDKESYVLFCGLQANHILPAKERVKELMKVADLFGYDWDIHQGPEVNNYNSHDFINVFEELINDKEPERIYIPYTSYNLDHQAVYDAAMIALRPHDKNWFVEKVLVYEGIGAFQWYEPDYEVNHFVKIDIDKKIEGYKLHASQVRGHRSLDHVRALATLRGSQIGVPAAEGYIVKRWVE